ncbi:F-box protein [Cardamine amara subsp. amara]|uniref:F-box protein n=1 Tax=Cardamine amara subsp. amara TaxID=228776 RepID=A0ABD1BSN0_CARAN
MGKGQRQKDVLRSSISPIENAMMMPIDLLVEILLRLSVVDIARCRCVSKLWYSILRRPDFTELFLKLSSTKPRILLAFENNDKVMFYSVPQDRDPTLTTSHVVPYYHMSFPKGMTGYTFVICTPVRGLVCSKTKKPMIYNPSTGEYITLPIATRKRVEMKTYLGYDPIDKIFKVLGVTYDDYACRGLTLCSLGTKEVTWRNIECAIPHIPLRPSEICINGVLYYLAKYVLGCEDPDKFMVVCFDIRSEKFKFLLDVDYELSLSVLIDYQGTLGALWPGPFDFDGRGTRIIKLWVLEDGDEMKWSETVYKLPYYWRFLAPGGIRINIVGMNARGEIVLSSFHLRDTVYIIYYDVVKKTTTSVEIHFGKVASEAPGSWLYTFVNHVANVELLMG